MGLKKELSMEHRGWSIVNFEVSRYRRVRHVEYFHLVNLIKIKERSCQKFVLFGPLGAGRNPGSE